MLFTLFKLFFFFGGGAWKKLASVPAGGQKGIEEFPVSLLAESLITGLLHKPKRENEQKRNNTNVQPSNCGGFVESVGTCWSRLLSGLPLPSFQQSGARI